MIYILGINGTKVISFLLCGILAIFHWETQMCPNNSKIAMLQLFLTQVLDTWTC